MTFIYQECKDVDILYATYPDLNHQIYARVAPRSCPGVGLGVQRVGVFMYFGHICLVFHETSTCVSQSNTNVFIFTSILVWFQL